MKSIVFKDKEDFHAWQCKTVRGLDTHAQESIDTMEFPAEYPCVMVWDIHEICDIDSRHPNELMDVLYYKYVYLDHFPVKRIKQGLYVYQVFQTSDCCD